MLISLAAAVAIQTCSWNSPGQDPYMGELSAAVQRYSHLEESTRAKLIQKIDGRRYDDVVEIKRDQIQGINDYAPTISDMNFGAGRICKTVDRSKWTDQHVERGLVYCADGVCIMVPTVCRNVSIVTKLKSLQPQTPVEHSIGGPIHPLGSGSVMTTGLAPVPTFETTINNERPFIGSATRGDAGYTWPPQLLFPTPPLPPAQPAPPVPEPSSLALFGAGIAVIFLIMFRRRP